jgi:FkbM family methyltransferase
MVEDVASDVRRMISQRILRSRLKNRFTMPELFVYSCCTYTDWIKLILARTRGRPGYLRIRGTRLCVPVGPENLNKCMYLARVLFYLKATQFGCRLRVFAPLNYYEDLRVSLVGNNVMHLRWLGWLTNLIRGGGYFVCVGHDIYAFIDGLKWLIRPHSEDIRLGALLGHGFEDHEYHKWFNKFVGYGSTFIDVGANVGGYAVRAAKKGARVHALEPSAGNFQVLGLNVSVNQLSLAAYNLAAGSGAGHATLYGRPGREGKFSLIPHEGDTIAEFVRVVSLDDLLLNKVGGVDLLKVDVEGGEWNVLRGSERLLKLTKRVFVEVRDLQLVEWMTCRGFTVRDVGTVFGDAVNILFEKS